MRRDWSFRLWTAGLALGLMMATSVVGVLAGRELDRQLAHAHTFIWLIGIAALLCGWILATRLAIRAPEG